MTVQKTGTTAPVWPKKKKLTSVTSLSVVDDYSFRDEQPEEARHQKIVEELQKWAGSESLELKRNESYRYQGSASENSDAFKVFAEALETGQSFAQLKSLSLQNTSTATPLNGGYSNTSSPRTTRYEKAPNPNNPIYFD